MFPTSRHLVATIVVLLLLTVMIPTDPFKDAPSDARCTGTSGGEGPGAGGDAPCHTRAGGTPHQPIRIDGDGGFTNASGVVWGSGTPSDPYILSGWTIDGTGYGYCIFVGNTTAHFCITDCHLADASGKNAEFHRDAGVELNNLTNATVALCNISANNDGVYLDAVSNSTVMQNEMNGSNWVGVRAPTYAFNVTIQGNHINSSGSGGIVLGSSHRSTVRSNTINGTKGDAITLQSGSDNNTVDNNTIDGGTGAGVRLASSGNNTICNNTITGNSGYGVEIPAGSNGNSVFHNNLIANNGDTVQAFDSGLGNLWDDGYPSGGNFWSDYIGTDAKKGQFQDQPGSDGFGDLPQTNIAGWSASQDYYPLMDSFGDLGAPAIFDLTVGPVKPHDDMVVRANITDDVCVAQARVNFTIGGGPWTNLSMTSMGGGLWERAVFIPCNSTGQFTYTIWAEDFANKWTGDGPNNLPIGPNDSPTFIGYDAPASMTTGEDFPFNANWTDSIGGVTAAWLTFFKGPVVYGNFSMVPSAGDNWTVNATAPGNFSGTMDFRFGARDHCAVVQYSPDLQRPLADNDKPVISNDTTPVAATTGDPVVFNATAADNVGVSSASVEYWFGAGGHTNSTMNLTAGYYLSEIYVPANMTSDLHYIFHAVDGAGRWVNTPPATTAIGDDDKPYRTVDLTNATGTTGELFHFKALIYDNVQVAEVTVEYWFGMGQHFNVSMDAPNPYNRSIPIPPDSLLTLHYIFHYNDSAGNRNQTGQRNVPVSDDDSPSFGADLTPPVGTTGDPFSFIVFVGDNLGLSQVRVNYSFDGSPSQNASMAGSAPAVKGILVPPGSAADLHYFFYAQDPTGNWAATANRTVTISDNDKPSFGVNSTDTAGTTGDPFHFEVAAGDNIGITQIRVEYWYGSGTHQVVNMNGPSPYTRNIMLEPGTTETLHYFFHAQDAAGNWATSEVEDAPISDNDDPIFGPDDTAPTGHTGDGFLFNVTVTDNMAVYGVFVEWWFGPGTHCNWSMNATGNAYAQKIDVPGDSLLQLHYVFHANDTAGHWIHSTQQDVNIQDNDGPNFGVNNTDAAGYTGDPFRFNITASDNIGVTQVKVEYWYGTGGHFVIPMTFNTSWYEHEMIVPGDSVETLRYHFTARDAKGNVNQSAQTNVTVTDNDPPVFGADATPASGTTGDPLTFQIAVGDNIGVVTVRVNYTDGAGGPYNLTMNGLGPYTRQVVVPAGFTSSIEYFFYTVDAAGNWNVTGNATVTITDDDDPVFGADATPDAGSTGDPFRFNITASDNLGITQVNVTYWYGAGAPVNVSMAGAGPYTLDIIIPAGSTETLHYFFWAGDASGNWGKTAVRDVPVSDDDKPVFGANTTAMVASTGDPFIFEIAVTDNVGVQFVTVEYWFGAGGHTNVTMAGPSPFNKTIDVPADSLAPLRYLFHAGDGAGVWNHSAQQTVPVKDNDAPAMGTNSSTYPPNDGKKFRFRIEFADNIAMHTVTVEYWVNDGTHSNVTMAWDNKKQLFKRDYNIPENTVGIFRYIFHANDTSGNWYISAQNDSAIVDVIAPEFHADLTNATGTTGEKITFSVNASDNTGLVAVQVRYYFGSDPATELNLTGPTPFGPYTIDVQISHNLTDDLHYQFYARDAAGNENLTALGHVTISDNDPPVFGADLTPGDGTTGDQFTFDIGAADNIGVASMTVEYWYEGNATHLNASMNPSTANRYTLVIFIPSDSNATLYYRFHACDDASIWNGTAAMAVNVTDDDRPDFGADKTPGSGTTGEQVQFKIDVTENVELAAVNVIYRFGGGAPVNDTMGGGPTFTLTIDVPSGSDDDIRFYFYAEDTGGNWRITPHYDVVIYDNDRPVFIADTTPGTGTTGEQFTFAVAITDNIAVTAVTVEYWFDGGVHTNTSMSGSGPYTLPISIPSESDMDLRYLFHTADTAGNWNKTSQINVPVHDNDSPAFGSDDSDTGATTGDDVSLTIGADDNIGVHTVKVEFWYGPAGQHFFWKLNGTGPYSIVLSAPIDSTASLHYRFHSNDSAGNTAQTGVVKLPVTDNDRAVFSADVTPDKGTTGEKHTFQLDIEDNIAVYTATVEFWYGTNVTHYNLTMNGTAGVYNLTIELPIYSLETLHYIFHANDTRGNWNQTVQKDVTIFQNDPPVFLADFTPPAWTTGDPMTFGVEVTDNIAVTKVAVEFWFGSGLHYNWTMNATGGDTFTLVITTPSYSTWTLHYIFHAKNTAGLWNHTGDLLSHDTVPITDNDPPVPVDDGTAEQATTGEQFAFIISWTDNIGMSMTTVEYWFGSTTPHTNVSMSKGPGSYYLLVMAVPSNSISKLHYVFHATDASGVWGHTGRVDVTVADNDKPAVTSDLTPSLGTTGDSFTFTVQASDNIGITNFTVEYWYGTSGVHHNATMTGKGTYTAKIVLSSDSVDDLHYQLKLRDEAGNKKQSLTADVTVMDNDKPTWGADSTPDLGRSEEKFTFTVQIYDNIGVSMARVVFWFGSGSKTNKTMNGGDPYYLSISVPDTIKPLHYFFFAMDAAGNWTTTAVRDVTITDDREAPRFGEDSTPPEGPTGGQLTFTVVVTDNEEIRNVTVEYWFGDGNHTARTMNLARGTFMEVIDLPANTTGTLYYFFNASDAVGNHNSTQVRKVDIVDDQAPALSGWGENADSGTTGSLYTFTVKASDNVGVQRVRVEYWFGSDERRNDTMEPAGDGAYTWEIALPVYSIAPMHFRFHATDAGDNTASSPVADATITDGTRPTADAGGYKTTKSGEELVLDGSDSSDNLGIVGYAWTIPYGDGVVLHGQVVNFVFEEAGTYLVTLTVRDSAGLTGQDQIEVTVQARETGVDFGILTDEDGNPLSDTEVTVEIDGETFVITTDDEGRVVLDLNDTYTGRDLNVTVDVEGLGSTSFKKTVDENGTAGNETADSPITISNEEVEGSGSRSALMEFLLKTLPAVALVIVLALILPLAVWSANKRRRAAIMSRWDEGLSVTSARRRDDDDDILDGMSGFPGTDGMVGDDSMEDDWAGIHPSGGGSPGFGPEGADVGGEAPVVVVPGSSPPGAPAAPEPEDEAAPEGPPPIFHTLFRPSWMALDDLEVEGGSGKAGRRERRAGGEKRGQKGKKKRRGTEKGGKRGKKKGRKRERRGAKTGGGPGGGPGGGAKDPGAGSTGPRPRSGPRGLPRTLPPASGEGPALLMKPPDDLPARRRPRGPGREAFPAPGASGEPRRLGGPTTGRGRGRAGGVKTGRPLRAPPGTRFRGSEPGATSADIALDKRLSTVRPAKRGRPGKKVPSAPRDIPGGKRRRGPKR